MPFIHPYDLDGSTLRGEEYGACVSLIIDESEPGQRPRLHRHAHDETWVIQEGTISLQVAEKRLTPGPGDIAIVPPGVRTSSPTMVRADQRSSASTPARRSSAMA